MDQYSKDYFPKGPAASYRLRSYACQCLQEIIQSNESLNDKNTFLRSMSSLTSKLLGIEVKEENKPDASTSQTYRPIPSQLSSSSSSSSSSSISLEPDTHRASLYSMQINKKPYVVTEDMKQASLQSLQKIQELRRSLLSSISHEYDRTNSHQEESSRFVSAMDQHYTAGSYFSPKKSVHFEENANENAIKNKDDEDDNNDKMPEEGDIDDGYESDNEENNTLSYSLLSSSIHNIQKSNILVKKYVRVLWDLENISVSRRLGGLAVVKKIHEFLESKDLLGIGIDTRVTAFFSPEHSPVSSKAIEELDKAGVELVWVSSKSGDADRKLGYRISQEMNVLKDIQNTVFVIISSDQDFRHHMKLLLSEGYRVIIVHNAPPGKWSQALEMQASEAYHWQNDVFGGTLPIKSRKSQSRGISTKVIPSSSSNLSPVTTTAVAAAAVVATTTYTVPTNQESIESKDLKKDDTEVIRTGNEKRRSRSRSRSRSQSPANETINLKESNPSTTVISSHNEVSSDMSTSPSIVSMATTVAVHEDKSMLSSSLPSSESLLNNMETPIMSEADAVVVNKSSKVPVRVDSAESTITVNSRIETIDEKNQLENVSTKPIQQDQEIFPTESSMKRVHNSIPEMSSVSNRARANESVDLSNLTFARLKELTGHY